MRSHPVSVVAAAAGIAAHWSNDDEGTQGAGMVTGIEYGSESGITVVGSGAAMAAVTGATLTLSVEVVDLDAGAAFAQAAQRVAELCAVLAAQRIDGHSVRTETVSLQPRYDYPDGTERLIGYQASQQLQAREVDPARVGEVLTAVAGIDGSVRIVALALTAGDLRQAGADARTAAMIDAREKAMSLAALAGRPLGRVVSVIDQTGGLSDPAPRPFALMAHSTREKSMPIATGDTEVSAAVRVHFAWAD